MDIDRVERVILLQEENKFKVTGIRINIKMKMLFYPKDQLLQKAVKSKALFAFKMNLDTFSKHANLQAEERELQCGIKPMALL